MTDLFTELDPKDDTQRDTVELLQEEFFHKTLVREAMGEQLASSSGRRRQKLEASMPSSARDNMFGKSGRLGSQRSSHRSRKDAFLSARKEKPTS